MKIASIASYLSEHSVIPHSEHFFSQINIITALTMKIFHGWRERERSYAALIASESLQRSIVPATLSS